MAASGRIKNTISQNNPGPMVRTARQRRPAGVNRSPNWMLVGLVMGLCPSILQGTQGGGRNGDGHFLSDTEFAAALGIQNKSLEHLAVDLNVIMSLRAAVNKRTNFAERGVARRSRLVQAQILGTNGQGNFTARQIIAVSSRQI